MSKKCKTLILGGTQFIGRNLVERMLKDSNYDISIFNRGKTNRNLFPEVSKIVGDRSTADVAQIQNEKWDLVIDLSCYYPEHLERVLDVLPSSVKKYVFVSTCSVYDNERYKGVLRNESAPILSCNKEERVSSDLSTYGNRKAECERILQNSGLDYCILRPALVYGKYDITDRFYYWLHQVYKNNILLIPDEGKRIFSTTYVLDLVEVILKAIDLKGKETFNVITTPKTAIERIISESEKTLNKTVERINARAKFLHENEIRQWVDMPLWLDTDDYTYDNTHLKELMHYNFNSLENNIAETIDYYSENNWPEPIFGMKENDRIELLSRLSK